MHFLSHSLYLCQRRSGGNRDLDGLCLGMARTLKLKYNENQIHCLCYKDSEHGFGSGKINGSIVEEEL